MVRFVLEWDRMRRRLRQLAGILALTWVWWRPGLLLPGLLALPSSGCCDCGGAFNELTVTSDTPITALDVSGDACQDASCDGPSRDVVGGCYEYRVRLIHLGTCSVTASAGGVQQSRDVAVTLLKQTCCGNIYNEEAVNFTFAGPPADAAVVDGATD